MIDQMADGDGFQRIQVGNLSGDATEAQLRALFLTHGRIAFYDRPINQQTRRPGTIVYVEMALGEAQAAIKALNGHRLGDLPLSVVAAEPLPAWAPAAERTPASRTPNRTVTPASTRGVANDEALHV